MRTVLTRSWSAATKTTPAATTMRDGLLHRLLPAERAGLGIEHDDAFGEHRDERLAGGRLAIGLHPSTVAVTRSPRRGVFA